MNITKRLQAAGVLAAALGLAACGGGSGAPPPRSAAAVAPAAPGELEAIVALLDGGEGRAARKRIAAALKRDPMNPSLQLLRDSIDRDPTELLGPTSHPYVTRPGDTMTGLAERFLGNRLKWYQLARYNAVDKPAALAPGRVLRIPGSAPAARQAVREEPRRDARRPTPAATRTQVPPKALAAPKARGADPGAAKVARAAGLAALNQGQVGRAIGLLRRAATLDPGNPLVGRDLARAERIASAVRARR